jgi:hypothetical protein
MASQSDLDSKADIDPPPLYDATPASATRLGVSQSTQSPSARSVFFRMLRSKRKHTSDESRINDQSHINDQSRIVLSRIRELVTSSDVTPSSVVPIVNSCAADISPAGFSDLLQSLNIRDHTAMYWAIMNNRREALLALSGYISKFSPICSSDLRLACMATSNHALFMQLNLKRRVGRKCMLPRERTLADLSCTNQPMTNLCYAL